MITSERRHDPATRAAPALGGGDVELGNFIQGLESSRDTCIEAATAILDEIDGYPPLEPAEPLFDAPSAPGVIGYGRRSFDPQDWCRKYLPGNGGCVYIDLGHTEVCLPEITSAREYVTYWHAMLGIVRQAQVLAGARLPEGQRLQVLVNNSDGLGNSYGAHLNFMLRRETFDDLLTRKLHWMLFLASYQVSSIVFTGQGKVGGENGQAPTRYQLSQRADFFETMTGIQTTFRRPLINLRDEALCGSSRGAGGADGQWSRLHVIFYDANLCEVACLLKFGVLQIILAMIAEDRVDPGLILRDPLEALPRWSRDVAMRRRMPLLLGGEVTAVELQLRFAEQARRYVDRGGCPVPEASMILDLWEDTLTKLQRGNLDALVSRIDWLLKLSAIDRAMKQGGHSWDAAPIKYLDLLYSSLDPNEGLYWSFRRAGMVERVVDDASIERAMVEPPTDTRAWTRAMLLRAAGPTAVHKVDWDSVELNVPVADGWAVRRTVDTDDPLGLTRDRAASIFVGDPGLAEVIDRLDAARERGVVSRTADT